MIDFFLFFLIWILSAALYSSDIVRNCREYGEAQTFHGTIKCEVKREQ